MPKEAHTRTAIVPGEEIQPIGAVSGSNELNILMSKSEISHRLGQLANSELLVTADAELALPSDPSDTEAKLLEVSELSAGRTRSKAGVQFGQLALVHDNQPPATELVAVKYMDPDTAAHEFRMNTYVSHRLGHRATYQTIGFVKPDNEKVGLVTRYEHRVVSLDNSLLDPKSSASERESATKIAAKYLATLHGEKLGLVHGDAQAKNIAVDSAQQLRFIDLEAARPVGENIHNSPINHPELNKLMDIGDFFALPSGAEDWHPTMEEIMAFMDTYLESQTGSHQLSEDDIFTLLSDKLEF